MSTIKPLNPGASRRHQLMIDPSITGNRLLVALAWDYLLEIEGIKALTLPRVCEVTGLKDREYGREVNNDIPRYNPPPAPRECQHLGPRGGRCALHVTHHRVLRDETTGEVSWVAACHLLTHRAWADHVADQHEASMRGPAPWPVYNHRSVLAPHFPEVNFRWWWAEMTARCDEYHRYNPDRDPQFGAAVVRPRPQLRLVTAMVGEQGVLL